MLAPVAEELARLGVERRLLSLTALRGFRSPQPEFAPSSTPVQSLTPSWFERKRGSKTASGNPTSSRRRWLRRLLWSLLLGPAIRRRLDDASGIAVLPNDSAFPYDRIVALLHRRKLPYLLLQEGIRFPLPGETDSRYGLGGAAALAVWGRSSADHFASLGVARDTIQVTGNPRFDGDPPLATPPEQPTLALITNPIDDQGFCSQGEKLALATEFVRRFLAARTSDGVRLLLRTHPGENSSSYLEMLASEQRARIEVASHENLDALLDDSTAVVVMASTVGLEALRRGRPLGVLPIPAHGYVHDYVARQAAIGLVLDSSLPQQVEQLLAPPIDSLLIDNYLESHLAHRGRAAERVAGLIIACMENRCRR